jgi:hypothetical protein
MKRNLNPGWLPMLALALVGWLPAARAQPVTGAEIQEKWVGKEVTGRAGNGARIIMTMNADGTAKLLIGAMPDNGSWRPWEQGYCATWKGLRGGQEMCFTVKREGDRFEIFRPDGTSNGFVDVK